MNTQSKNNQIIIYNTKDGETKIEAQVKDEDRLAFAKIKIQLPRNTR